MTSEPESSLEQPSSREQNGAVKAWCEPVVIPTYPVPPPDPNPMFLEKRVYQGSSGKVYPNPFTDRVSDERFDKTYQAVHLENEHLYLMILPEIGGRIHIGYDKTNGYDFFYRQNVIKPALVGLLGPWISGGVEFNWPQHHRPSTFMPVDYHIESHADDSRTIWLSEHEPMNRMKGMVGICLHPGKAFVEAKVRLFNRTPFVQSFLWWANVAVHVHDQYQAFFPPDVSYVADHAKRAVSHYPIARGFYYGVDYTSGVDISWYKNIPVPTSYMVPESRYDFFGGYDYRQRAGVVHVADHHISPGKKLWTWGNAEFGYAWDRELTDADGPYVELMAGVYTDNQPDFSWLHPYETKTFEQYWYPIQKIGPAKNANRRAAINLDVDDRRAKLGVSVTETLSRATVQLTARGEIVLERTVDLAPDRPFVEEVSLPEEIVGKDCLLRVLSEQGDELIHYAPEEAGEAPLPEPATEPPLPPEIHTTEELYLAGLHLEQYRHATRYPEDYWDEALRREPGDVSSNNALGLLHLRRGEFERSERHFRRAIETLTRLNPNPYDGEPYYNLGLALKYQNRLDEAYDAFYKAIWSYAWQAPGYYALAEIDCRHEDNDTALDHLERALLTNAANIKARNLRAAVLRRSGRYEEAEALVRETVATDSLDFWSRNELVLISRERGDSAAAENRLRQLGGLMRGEVQTHLDLALDYAAAGLWEEAADLLRRLLPADGEEAAVYPMVYYALGFLAEWRGETEEARAYRQQGARMPPDYCFPARLEEAEILRTAHEANPEDAGAFYYLGNLLYDKKRYEEAIDNWETSCRLEPSFSIPWRNLGIAYFNVRNDPEKSKECYLKAFDANPKDARLLFELDQLVKRLGSAPPERLARLKEHLDLVEQRDDLYVEYVTLLNQMGEPETALELLRTRRFHPWEGGEGKVSSQFVTAHLLLGRKALEAGDAERALEHIEAAQSYPESLGEGKHLLTPEADLRYLAGLARKALRDEEGSKACFQKAAGTETPPSRMTYYQALAMKELGEGAASARKLEELLAFAEKEMHSEVKIDYFATSLPNFLIFEDDLQKRNWVDCTFLKGLAYLGLGQISEAKKAFRDVLALDVNHLWAQEELAVLGSGNRT
jgi:tetratricopeptide (TPR) repeat protein